jgi:hypothetical protein
MTEEPDKDPGGWGTPAEAAEAESGGRAAFSLGRPENNGDLGHDRDTFLQIQGYLVGQPFAVLRESLN